jgi:hypothetical protein
VRVVERQGPTLIEKLLAEKLGTPAPQATPPREPEQQVATAPKPAPLPPPPAPKVEEEPAVVAKPQPEKPAVVASAPRASAPPRLIAPLTQGTRPTPEVTAPLPPPPAAKPTTKPAPPEKPEVARKAQPPAKPQVAKKPEPAKPQVVAKSEPTPAREIAAAPAPKPETVQVATKPQPSAPAPLPVQERPVPVQERPIQVQERAVAVERVEVARPVERPVERLVVEPVPAQTAAVASVPVAEAPVAEPPSADVERVAAVRSATAPARGAGPSQDAVRGLLDRYAAAWRGHDVDTLRAIGQITNDGQASAMRAYFANVGDLEVEVRVLDIRSDGDRATVRFTRRDRFRDPAGREIAKESPPIEKHVVTTPQGVRFGPSS